MIVTYFEEEEEEENMEDDYLISLMDLRITVGIPIGTKE